MSKVIIGVDLGGTNVKTALVTEDRTLIAKDSRETFAEEGLDKVVSVMEASVRDLLQQNNIDTADVLAAGFGAPGPMNWQTGMVFSPPNLPGWHNVPLADIMKEKLGIPCYVDNDANVACYGEYWMGAGQGAESIVVLTLGTGVGGGIVIDGKLLRGIDGTAAELGHIKVQRDGRKCGCGVKGCLEAYASVTGMVRTALEGLESGRESALHEFSGGDLEAITGRMISEAAKSGDAFAKEVFKETATWLGIGLGSLVNALNPEKAILCGGMIAAGEELLFEPIRETVKQNAFEVPANRCEIIPAGLGNDAGVLGSAGCALARVQAG